MDEQKVRDRLMAMRAELTALSEGAADSRKAVELDQQSVGRLSRQDALQQQAMANAADSKRLVEIRRIDAALKRLDEGEYGWCADCGEAIAPRRLDLDPCVAVCIDCARGG